MVKKRASSGRARDSMAGCGGLEFVVADKRLELGVACHYSRVPAKSGSNRQARVILNLEQMFHVEQSGPLCRLDGA